MGSPPGAPAADMTTRFLRALYGAYPPEANLRVEVRTFAPEWRDRLAAGRPPRAWFALTDAGRFYAARFALGAAARGWETYVGVLPRVNGGGGGEHLRLAGCLWLDMDGGSDGPEDAAALLKARLLALCLPAPHLLVLSGGGVHAYWLLAEPVPCHAPEEQQRFRQVLVRLVRAVGGDLSRAHACPKATDCARILRLPGTLNLKRPDEPRPVRLLRLDESGERLPLLWWEANLPALPLPPKRKEQRHPARPVGPWLSDRMLGWLTEPARDGERHYKLVDTAARMQAHGQPPDVIRAVLLDKARNSGVPVDDPHQQRHIDAIVDWATRTVAPDYSAT